MWMHLLQTFWRNLRRQRTFSLINIVGLTLGLAGGLLILLWVQDERSYDRFHADAGSIFRVIMKGTVDGHSFSAASTPGRFAEALRSELPEVAETVRVRFQPGQLFRSADKVFFEDGGAIVDPAFLRVFSFSMKQGNPTTALDSPDSLVLTTALARKYFGESDPMGRLVEFMNMPFRVTGVVADVPYNSSIRFDFLCSTRLLDAHPIIPVDWYSDWFITFVKLHDPASVEAVRPKVTPLILDRAPLFDRMGRAVDLQPLTSIHLQSGFRSEDLVTANPLYVQVFTFVAVGILLIACVNFMNLATARSVSRAREVGVRKVLGSSRRLLVFQFLGEAMGMTAIAVFLAVVIVQLSLPVFNPLFEKNLVLEFLDPGFGLTLMAGLMLTALVAGIYPAIVLSGFQPVAVLTERFGTSRQGSGFRRILVVFQFAVSAFLLIATGVIHSQLMFIRNLPLGFNKDNVLLLPAKGAAAKAYPVLRQALDEHPRIRAVTFAGGPPQERSDGGPVARVGQRMELQVPYEYFNVDLNFVSAMGLTVVAGRDLSADRPSDRSDACLVNEMAARILGGNAEVLGQRVAFSNGNPRTVVGVVADAHFKSLHGVIEPLVIRPMGEPSDYGHHGVMLIHMDGRETPATLAAVRRAWEANLPDLPFEYHFLDMAYGRLYHADERLGLVVNMFSVLAVVLSCIGLLGLAAYTAERRTKEIGIRKALGASIPDIIMLLSREFGLWVLLANLLAWPVAYWAALSWLATYAYRTEPNIWIFAGVGFGMLVLASLVAGLQTLRAAWVDPVRVLRYE